MSPLVLLCVVYSPFPIDAGDAGDTEVLRRTPISREMECFAGWPVLLVVRVATVTSASSRFGEEGLRGHMGQSGPPPPLPSFLFVESVLAIGWKTSDAVATC
ncbi:unnamed protein product [Rhizoctonia solani]|uniref:Secreted protein n=1 Tax=Rhizoctonia solani TaxID=456999 RepID=A0A8H3B9V4_9AGAM|nr:unnamed protein product [Rhizoctonia solani]